MLDKKAMRYVVFFLFVFELVFAIICWADIRTAYICAGLSHLRPLSIVMYRQACASQVGGSFYLFSWLDTFFPFTIPHALMLVLVISVILFTFGIFVKNVVKKLIEKKRGFTIVE